MQGTPTFDYIVIGAGSAGCVAASRLVSEFGAEVLLLEGGFPDHHPLIHMPAGFVKMVFNPGRFLVNHVSEPQPALSGRRVGVLQANVIGGGSSVNAMTYTRGARADYDKWDDALGGVGWGWDDLLPHFIRQEGNQRLGAPFHGVDGPLKVSDAHHPPTRISRAFLLTLQEMGIPFTPDVNAGDERGATFIQSTTYFGRRCSAAEAFIAPLKGNPRLKIKFRSPALRILFEGDRAVGVEFSDQGKGVARAFARQEVVLAAGAFISPKLLMLSGIGPAADLSRLGIDVKVDLPGVGQNMQDHNDASIAVQTTANFGFSGEDRGRRMLANGLQYLLFRSGPVASTGSEVTAFLNPLSPGSAPTIQLYCVGTLYPEPGNKRRQPPGATLIANLVAPKSRGAMRLRSADPADAPIIDPGWLTRVEDVQELVGGVKFLRQVVNTRPFSDKVARVLLPDTLTSDEEIANYVRRVTGTNWHPVGGCRMGPASDPMSVVDPELRVRGVTGLRVFDGSIMPNIISANTNAPIMAIADRAVSLMMGTASLREKLNVNDNEEEAHD
ncbi:GMC family oxidoreductase [Paraburkholderia elongata]|uniref:Glucose-methanol-choline oxidoreductase n=1 Tax=Paraburkholderia elongata TaxID=2675747 RepID=A0A972NI08_9BURK|nr:GMC family oxidoreductase N-terminal domain-containing protein [Paraburkholderia elongata]NPT53064.1 glucose-methanol-choline oxidoreductase [Paraburkholderia elongata]